MILNGTGYVGDSDNRMVLLWENDSIERGFEAQTIDVDTNGYKTLFITFRVSIGQYTIGTAMIPIEVISHQFPFTFGTMYGAVQCSRTITMDTTGITFGSGEYRFYNSPGLITSGDDDTYAIPYRIYGTY